MSTGRIGIFFFFFLNRARVKIIKLGKACLHRKTRLLSQFATTISPNICQLRRELVWSLKLYETVITEGLRRYATCANLKRTTFSAMWALS